MDGSEVASQGISWLGTADPDAKKLVKYDEETD